MTNQDVIDEFDLMEASAVGIPAYPSTINKETKDIIEASKDALKNLNSKTEVITLKKDVNKDTEKTPKVDKTVKDEKVDNVKDAKDKPDVEDKDTKTEDTKDTKTEDTKDTKDTKTKDSEEEDTDKSKEITLTKEQFEELTNTIKDKIIKTLVRESKTDKKEKFDNPLKDKSIGELGALFIDKK